MKYRLLFLSLLSLSACYEEPEFPLEPKIEFEQVQFIDSSVDSLNVTISFQDGNGDLGLASNQTTNPYHPFDYAFLVNGEYSFITIGQFDTLPAHNCSNYLSGYFDEVGNFYSSTTPDEITDTIYIQRNPFHYNFFVELYTVEGGTENLINTVEQFYPTCGETYNGRFQLNPKDDGDPISGSITYSVPGALLLPLYGDDSLKLKIRIADRALNMSNLVESPVFTLRGVQRQ